MITDNGRWRGSPSFDVILPNDRRRRRSVSFRLTCPGYFEFNRPGGAVFRSAGKLGKKRGRHKLLFLC